MLDYFLGIISSSIANPVIVSVILGILPVSEIRGAAIYSFSIGQPILILPAMVANIIVCPLILLFWDVINIPKIASTILGGSLEKKLLKFGRNYEKQGLLALILFIGIPLPLTGVYTGTLLAELLGIKRRNILLASVIGVVLATVIMFFALGGFSLLVH